LNTSENAGLSKKCPSKAFARALVRVNVGEGYNLTIGKSPKFIWYRNAKVATRTTLNALDQTGIIYQIREAASVNYNPSDLDTYFKFAFVRNPWDRLVSGWKNRIAGKIAQGPKWYGTISKNFDGLIDFLETLDLTQCDPHFRLQTCLIPLEAVDFLGRFETFDSDFKKVLAQLDIKSAIKLHRKNATKNRHPYQHYYTPELRDRVAKLYQQDIEALGYEF